MNGPTITHDNGVVEIIDDAADVPGRATCGACGRSWDDSVSTARTPAPSARCPFEYEHEDEDEDEYEDEAASMRDALSMAWHAVDEAARLMPDERILVRGLWVTLAEVADDLYPYAIGANQ